MSICKKHGKERNVIVRSKPSSKGGAVIEYTGCEDCAAGLPSRNPQVKEKSKKKKVKAVKYDTPETVEKKMEHVKKVRSIGERFGFKF